MGGGQGQGDIRGKERGGREEKKREWWGQGKGTGTERGRRRLREPTDICVKWFLNELWKMVWKSSRINVGWIIEGQLRDDIVLDENGDGDKEKWSYLKNIYGIKWTELVSDWNMHL